MRTDLRNARLAAGLTQTDVAARIGKDQGTVSRYEGGKSSVDIAIAPRLAEVLRLDLLAVIYGRHVERGEKTVRPA